MSPPRNSWKSSGRRGARPGNCNEAGNNALSESNCQHQINVSSGAKQRQNTANQSTIRNIKQSSAIGPGGSDTTPLGQEVGDDTSRAFNRPIGALQAGHHRDQGISDYSSRSAALRPLHPGNNYNSNNLRNQSSSASSLPSPSLSTTARQSSSYSSRRSPHTSELKSNDIRRYFQPIPTSKPSQVVTSISTGTASIPPQSMTCKPRPAENSTPGIKRNNSSKVTVKDSGEPDTWHDDSCHTFDWALRTRS